MPGGKNNLNGNDGKLFSSEYQPKNRRKSTKHLTDMLRSSLKERKDVFIEGEDITTGKKVKIKVAMPTNRIIVATLCRLAAKGNLKAIELIWDRIEGKPKQQTDMNFDWENLSDEQLDVVIAKVISKTLKMVQ